jgi:hypothetical protein
MIIHDNAMHDGKRFYVVRQPSGYCIVLPKKGAHKNNVMAAANINIGQQAIETLFNASQGQYWAFYQMPIPITNGYEFYDIRHNPGGNYTLMNDISLVGVPWVPFIFTGTFNGNGKTISGLTIEYGAVTTLNDFALFAISHGHLYNFTLTGARIFNHSDHTNVWSYHGAVVGRNAGTIENVTVHHLKMEVHRCYSAAGGIVGENTGTIINCNVDGVEVVGNGDLGGIAGANYGGTISNCTSYHSRISHIYVQIDRSIGGIVGCVNGGTLENVTVTGGVVENTGDDGVSPNRQPHMGKIVGRIHNANFFYPRANINWPTTLHPGQLGSNNLQHFGNADWGNATLNAALVQYAGLQSNNSTWI